MSYQAKWIVSGTTLDDSANALIKATQPIQDGTFLKKYENRLNKHFQENIRKYLQLSGTEIEHFDDTLFLKIYNNSINFVNTAPLVTQRYEYGYYDNNPDEEYDEGYIIQTSPRYFIRPAMQDSLNEIEELLVQEVNSNYMNNRYQTYGDEIYE